MITEGTQVHTQTRHMFKWRNTHTCVSSHPNSSISLQGQTSPGRKHASLKTSASFLLISTSLGSSPALRPIWDPTMDRSVQELFLNFMIVLITVLLMWLLVKTYQDWSMERQEGREAKGMEESQHGSCRTVYSVYVFHSVSWSTASYSREVKKHVIATTRWADLPKTNESGICVCFLKYFLNVALNISGKGQRITHSRDGGWIK